MTELSDLQPQLEETRERFLKLADAQRPALHRYCTRMLGSAIDGEDLVQEVLSQAYFKLSLLKQDVPLRPWLFRIAHNRCIDALRLRRGEVRALLEADDLAPVEDDAVEREQAVRAALEAMVGELPAKERSCLLLKDVLDHSLEEIAETLGSSVGAVKAALHRAREKLKTRDERNATPRPRGPEQERLLRLYVERFNARDWTALKHLLRADAQIEVVGNWVAQGQDPASEGYFGKYALYDWWRLSLARVDGELVVFSERRDDDGVWGPWSVHRIRWRDGQVASIRDYLFATYLLGEAKVERLD